MGSRHILASTRFYVFCAFLLALASPVTALALQNITIGLPPGSSDHGTPGLLCTPTQPLDLLFFYLLNYVAHATTVLSRPGERDDDYFVSIIGSLLFPSLGLYRGIEAILSGTVWVRNDDLRKAAKSGALCMVVRGADWRPVDGDTISNGILKRSDTSGEQEAGSPFDTNYMKEKSIHTIVFTPPYIFARFGCPVFVHRRIIHGTHSLPAGYRFAILPHDVQFSTSHPYSFPSLDPSSRPTIEVSATYNMVKAFIALVQSAYALSTLYRSRGDQISQLGYAAFGLTVAPYAVMSIVNLIGNLCRPDYPSLYMVESSIMDEARRRGGLFTGAVSRVCEDEGTSVCACGFAEGEELEDLRFFANETGEVEAHFSTADPLAYIKHAEEQKNEKEPFDLSATESKTRLSTAPTASSSLVTHTHTLAPLPDNMNYINTQNSPLLLIPCHAPVIRSTPPISPSPNEAPPTRHAISSISLRRTFPFRKYSTWKPVFSTSLFFIRARRWRLAKYTLTIIIALLPLLITGLLSRFRSGSIPADESSTWRIYTMQWVCMGVFTGVWLALDQEGKDAMASARMQKGPLVRAIVYVINASPAVGGYVVVGQMLYRYGVCVWIG